MSKLNQACKPKPLFAKNPTGEEREFESADLKDKKSEKEKIELMVHIGSYI